MRDKVVYAQECLDIVQPLHQQAVAVKPDSAVSLQQKGTDEIGSLRRPQAFDVDVPVLIPDQLEIGGIEKMG